jgi:spore germination protein GerM
LKDGNIDLDLSKNFIEDRFVSDPADILLIHSVVNTLTEFKEVNTVTFYIDGGKGSSLGQVDISAPVFRDESFNQKN